MPAINAQDRDALVANSGGTRQERTITANRQREVDRLAIYVLRLLLAVPILRKTRVLTQVQFLT